MTAPLDVWLEGRPAPVGRLLPGPGLALRFAYDPAHVADPAAPALSVRLPVRAEPYGDAAARAFFDNLLPEGEPRAAIAARHRLDAGDVLGLLGVLGADAPGAVSVVPAGAPPAKSPGRMPEDYEPLAEAALETAVLAAAQGRAPGERLRFSLAGVQAKLALAFDAEGRPLLPRGGAPSTHILKVERAFARERGIVANEFACLTLFRRLGLEAVVAERRVIAGTPCLLVPRYDRRREERGLLVRRLHQEDAAQVLGLDRSLKYEAEAERAGLRAGLAELLGPFAAACTVPLEARETLFRAAFGNWLVGNSDAHMKNFALLHGAPGPRLAGVALPPPLRLAPLYDVVCIAAWPDFSHDPAMRLSPDGRWDGVERVHWEGLATLAYGRRSRVAIRGALERLRATAAAALPELDAMVAEGLLEVREVKLLRDVIGARLRHLNRTIGWGIPADTDAPILRGGGWAMS